MHNHYNRYSYVLNNPLKYTDPSGWVAMASRLTTVLLPEDYRNNIEGGYKSGGGGGYSDMSFDYNYAGSYSMYASNPAMCAFMYGPQTWMQTATQNPSSYFSVNSNSIYTNNPQKIGSILNNISRGGTVSEIFELYGGTAPGITIYSTATGFKTDQQSFNKAYSWIQNSLNGIGGSTNNGGIPSYLITTNTIVGALSIGNSATTEIIDYGVRNSFKSATTRSTFNALKETQKVWRYNNILGKSGTNFLNISKTIGVVFGVANVTYSIANTAIYYYSGGDKWQVAAKNGLDIAMTGISFLGPIGVGVGATYFIIDNATGHFGGFGSTTTKP